MLPSSTSSRPSSAVALIRKRPPAPVAIVCSAGDAGRRGRSYGRPVEVSWVESAVSNSMPSGIAEQCARGCIRRRCRRRADEDAVGDAFEHRVELEPVRPSRSERSAIDVSRVSVRRRPRPSPRPPPSSWLVPDRVEQVRDSARGDERNANDEKVLPALSRGGPAAPEWHVRLRSPPLPSPDGSDDARRPRRPGTTVPMAQVVVPDDDREPVAAEERQPLLRQDLEGLVEGRGLVDGDRGVDHSSLAARPRTGSCSASYSGCLCYRFGIWNVHDNYWHRRWEPVSLEVCCSHPPNRGYPIEPFRG